jgi:transposase
LVQTEKLSGERPGIGSGRKINATPTAETRRKAKAFTTEDTKDHRGRTKISDFANEDKLAAYLGLVPRITNSNESERSGRITKQGNKLARTALVQCGLVAKRYSPYLSRFYERIKQRRGGGKAKIALARKLVKIVYDTLKNQWIFEDFPSFTLAA